MKTTFTTPCFIRKNTSELRIKLEEFGYIIRPLMPKMDGNHNELLFCNKDRYSETIFGYPEDIESAIDCGTNEDLFLAVAALREDSDIHQWFIYDTMDCVMKECRTREFIRCETDNIKDVLVYSGSRKATVEELIEHFKTK